MPENKTPSDVLIALFFLSGQTHFSSDQNLLAKAVFEAGEVSVLVRYEFGFSGSGRRQSSDLDQAFAELRFVRILHTETPDLDRVYLDGQAKEYISSKVLPRFSAAELEELRRAAAVVGERCGATREGERRIEA